LERRSNVGGREEIVSPRGVERRDLDFSPMKVEKGVRFSNQVFISTICEELM